MVNREMHVAGLIDARTPDDFFVAGSGA